MIRYRFDFDVNPDNKLVYGVQSEWVRADEAEQEIERLRAQLETVTQVHKQLIEVHADIVNKTIEECAKVCDGLEAQRHDYSDWPGPEECARALRALKSKAANGSETLLEKIEAANKRNVP